MRLAGKVAIITGGACGMGACEAKPFAKEGAKLVMVGFGTGLEFLASLVGHLP